MGPSSGAGNQTGAMGGAASGSNDQIGTMGASTALSLTYLFGQANKDLDKSTAADGLNSNGGVGAAAPMQDPFSEAGADFGVESTFIDAMIMSSDNGMLDGCFDEEGAAGSLEGAGDFWDYAGDDPFGDGRLDSKNLF